MTEESKEQAVATAMEQINQAWLGGRVDEMASRVHPDIIMVVPGFSGRARGREGFLDGFRGFCQSATISEFKEEDRHIDIAGDTAVVTFRYAMVYEHSGQRYRATGRDLWVFQRAGGVWLAVWRTMLDLEETAA